MARNKAKQEKHKRRRAVRRSLYRQTVRRDNEKAIAAATETYREMHAAAAAETLRTEYEYFHPPTTVSRGIRLLHKRCGWCSRYLHRGRLYPLRRAHARYCSPSCRSQASRSRRQQKDAADCG